MNAIPVVDIFCGVGGLTHGFVKEGFNVVAGLDIDSSCGYAYEQNNGAKFLCKKIEDVEVQDILDLHPLNHIKVLVGCAPCQPFSKYRSKNGPKDEKWKLLDVFANLIAAVQPHVVSMENVPELIKFNQGTVYANFIKSLIAVEYIVTPYLVYCPDYGIPQRRTRLVLFASKFGRVNLVEKTHTSERYRTVRDTISDLPSIESGMSYMDDPLHKAYGLSDLNLKRIKQSVPGESWEIWDEELRSICHTNKSGSTYTSVYGRMLWDEPAPTLTTECYAYGSGRFGHPDQNRAISLREASLLQTFPRDYMFAAPEDPLHFKTVGRHIGNAVPVELGRIIAKSIARHLEEYNDDGWQSIQDVHQHECPQSFGDRSV